MISRGVVRSVGSAMLRLRGELASIPQGPSAVLKAASVQCQLLDRRVATSAQPPEDASPQRSLEEPAAANLAASIPEQELQSPSPSAQLVSEDDELLQLAGLQAQAPRQAPLPEDFVPAEPMGDARDPEPSRRRGVGSDGIPLPHFVRSEAAEKVQKSVLGLSEAIKLVTGSARAKFDETVEVHVNLGIDPRRGDQMVRGAATLPRGTGKAVRVAVFAEGAAAEEALAAGADVVGAEDLVARVKESGGKLDFDKCIATPSLMPKLGQVARILGPRGLMPNPKVGTVTLAVGEAVRAAKRGRVDFRADKTGIVHAGVGKASFTPEALEENIAAFAAALLDAKPVGLKKSSKFVGYFTGFSLSSTMGPGVRVNIQSVASAADGYARRKAAQ